MMLSISNMSPEAVANYHDEDKNYYHEDELQGKWQGQGVDNLNLREFNYNDFKRLCNGIHPFEDKVLVDSSKRAGTDLTFSAPKSISILIEISTKEIEKEIRLAHDIAVKNTLSYIEKDYAQTRQQLFGIREVLNTKNLLIAKFQHDISRELDPQLHTHAFILNLTQKGNSEWRALHNDLLFKNKQFFGQIYRNELSLNIRKMGYGIEITDVKNGFFEVSGISKKLINEFSKRTEQVNNSYEELKRKFPNFNEWKLREMAKLDSRKSKNKKMNRVEIKKNNLYRAESIENVDNVLDSVKFKNFKNKKLTLKQYFDIAKEILTNKESVFTKELLLREVMKLSIGEYRLDDYLEEFTKDKELIKLDKNVYSTLEIVNIEKEILKKIELYKNSFNSISSENQLSSFIERNFSKMTKGQKTSFINILNNNDLICTIQGDAGSGKTYMLRAVEKFINDKSSIQGLSFTAKASYELEKESNITSSTLNTFFNQKEFKNNQIYIVDEASMLGSKQIKALIDKAIETNSRIVLVGDIKQFQPITAGAIFEQLQKEGLIKTSYMNETIRANTIIMKSLYSDVKSKNIESAFKTLESNSLIIESNNLDEIKNEYLKDLNHSLLIVSKNTDRIILNNLIRNSLIQNKSKSRLIYTRESTNLNELEKHFYRYYKENQTVIINKGIKGLKAGTQGIIKSIDSNSNSILIYANEKNIIIDLKKDGQKISTYENLKKEFAINEKIIFTKNNKEINIKNGQTAKIIGFNKNIVYVEKDNNIISIDTNEYNYFDYSYAITDYKSQGQTSEKVIILTDADRANTNSLYVQITRAKKEVKIFTNSIDRLKINAVKSQAKSTTIEYFRTKVIEEKNQNEGLHYEQVTRKSIISILGEYGEKLRVKFGTISNDIKNFIRGKKYLSEEFKVDIRKNRYRINELRKEKELNVVRNLIDNLNKDKSLEIGQGY
ncbi:MobF family relaxase [Arcobacter arenosus]|uniref:Conjugative relaxase n=1 Tax=Arcobacter arenosus TaxID=2576037 RepID=A0A5R8XY75_9BACT|nr:MobF family relaxase [Arcobacter arenosus]TLP36211.1 conjugative relaxase [Arcobacter arenosus]